MKQVIYGLLDGYELGRISRSQLIQALAAIGGATYLISACTSTLQGILAEADHIVAVNDDVAGDDADSVAESESPRRVMPKGGFGGIDGLRRQATSLFLRHG